MKPRPPRSTRTYTLLPDTTLFRSLVETRDMLFKALAVPTRRALFERLCEQGEQTVGMLTAQAGVSQPAVSKHLAILRQAGLVLDRQQGRQAHYSARPAALEPLAD